MSFSQEFGIAGEAEASRFLRSKGMRVLEYQYRTSFGEVDLVCTDEDTYVFVEVKTRQEDPEVPALEAVTPAKQRRIVRAALAYMKHKGLQGVAVRFDIVTIEDGHIEWYPDAFPAPAIYTL